MICPKCGYNNDLDAAFCENCGRPLKRQPSNGFNETTKFLLVSIILLVVALGITGGFLLKNSQKTARQNSNPSQISEANGIPLSEVPNLASGISKTNGSLSIITYGSLTLDQNQCIYILARAIVMIDQGQEGNVPIKSFGSAPHPYGNTASATISRSQYVDIASRMYRWMDNNGFTPNFIGINNPGQPDLSPTSALNLFSKVLTQYKSTGQLPVTVNI